MTENEIKEMLKDIIDNGAEYEYTYLDRNGDYRPYQKYKLGNEIFSNYKYRKVVKWCVVEFEDGHFQIKNTKTYMDVVFESNTKEECEKWIKEHTKTWLEETCENRVMYEKDYLKEESEHIHNSTKYGIVEVCKKILEEMDKTTKERQIRNECFPLTFQKRDIEQIIFHLGVEL